MSQQSESPQLIGKGKTGRLNYVGKDTDEFLTTAALSAAEKDKLFDGGLGHDGLIDRMYEKHLQAEEIVLSKLQNALESGTFNLIVAVVICCNAITIGMETDSTDPDLAPTFQLVERIFLVFYIFELGLRFWVFRCKAFRDPWYVLDFTIVLCAIFDLIVDALDVDLGVSLSAATMLRVIRLVKLVRLFRLLRFFSELLLLVNSIASAMRTLLWTWVLLGLVIYVFSIAYTKMLGQQHPKNEDIQIYFGTCVRSGFTLFAIMTLDWADTTRIIWDVEPMMVIMTLVFITITAFAIMNVVIAVIVESTIQQAMKNNDDKESQIEEELKAAAESMIKVFATADTDADGKMSKEEWKQVVSQPRVQKIFKGMDLDCNAVEGLEYIFDRLDIDEDGKITLHEFVQGTLQLRGQARAKRVFEMHCDLIRESNIMNKQMTSVKRMQKMQSMALDGISRKLDSMAPEVEEEPETQGSISLAVGCSVQLVNMKDGSFNGRVGTIVRDLSTESRSEFLIDLGDSLPAILVEKENLQIADQVNGTEVPSAKKEVSQEIQKEEVKKESKKHKVKEAEMQLVPVAACRQSEMHAVLLTAIARQSAALANVDAKVQTLSDTVVSLAQHNAQRPSSGPSAQALTQIICQPTQSPDCMGGPPEPALHALENRMSVRSIVLEEEMRALRETILQCLPQLRAPLLRNSQVLS